MLLKLKESCPVFLLRMIAVASEVEEGSKYFLDLSEDFRFKAMEVLVRSLS